MTRGTMLLSVVAPPRIATWVGLAASVLALVGIVYALVVRLFTEWAVPGSAGIIVAVLFTGGVQLVATGTIGEYVGRIFTESKLRPLYVIAELSARGSDGDQTRARRRELAPMSERR